MVTISDIDKLLSSEAPGELSESWDNDGVMLCGCISAETKKVLIMLEVSEEGAEYAVKNGFDLIVTHHPFIFRPLSRITESVYSQVELLIKNKISVLSYHTRMDSAQHGVNFAAAKLMNLQNVKGFGGDSGSIGKIGELAEALSTYEFAELLKEKFKCGTIRASLFKTKDKKIKKVAVVGGAGKGFFFDAYLAGADAYVTSEAAHNTFIDCKNLDMCLFDCGHYFTENPVCEIFKSIIDEKFGNKIQTEIFDVKSPYVNI